MSSIIAIDPNSSKSFPEPYVKLTLILIGEILVRNEFIQRVDSSSSDPIIKSYLKNVLHTNYKKYKMGLEYRYNAIKNTRSGTEV